MHAVTIVRPPCKFFGFGLWKLKYAHCGYCKIGSPSGATGIDGMLWGCSDNSGGSDNSDHVDDCDKFDELKNFDMLSQMPSTSAPLMARSRCDALFMHYILHLYTKAEETSLDGGAGINVSESRR